MSRFARERADLERAARAVRNPAATSTGAPPFTDRWGRLPKPTRRQPATIAEERRVHKFERAGLGKAPFRYLSSETKTYQPVPGSVPRAGSSCDYCSTAIAVVHWIQGSGTDDRPFKVGSDCVMKMGDAGLRVMIESVERRLAREKRRLRTRAVTDEVAEALRQPDVRAVLAAQPHPRGFTDRETGAPLTLLDWAEWMLANAGAKGRAAVRAEVRRLRP